MKNNKKKSIPKYSFGGKAKILPKYELGGGGYNESGFNISDQGGSGTSNMYNNKRTKNMYGNEPGTGASTGQKMAMAGAVVEGGMNTYKNFNNPNASIRTKSESLDGAVTGVATAINPVVGMAIGAGDMIGKPIRSHVERMDDQGNLKNEGDARAGAIVGSFFNPIKAITNRASYKGGFTDFSGKGYTNALEKEAKDNIASQQAQQDTANQQQAAYQQQQNDYINNAIQSGLAKNQNQGSYVQYAMGGMQYANGGNGQINAEVEKQENSVAPNGQFTQFDGPSHANGGIKSDIPGGSKIFSDKLKAPGTKKTFAELNKVNNTNKEDKILESGKHGNISKHTAMLMSMAKNKNSDALFNEQEALKQAKVEAYAKKMGVTLPQPSMNNEQMEPQGEFAMGGVQLPYYNTPKFVKGGTKVPESVRFVPTMTDESQDADVIVPGTPRTQAPDFTNIIQADPYNTFGKPLDTWSAARLNKSAWDEDYINNPNAKKPTEETNPNSKNFDWGKLTMNVGNFAGQNAGNIYDLSRKNAPLQKYDRATASYLDATAAMRDANEQTRRAEYNVRGASGGNAGTYLANRVGLNAQNIMTKDRIRQQYANANAQIGNQLSQYNTEIAYREAEARAKDAAMKENIRSQAIHGIGSSFGKATKSGKQDEMDEKTLAMYKEYYNNPQFRAALKKAGYDV